MCQKKPFPRCANHIREQLNHVTHQQVQIKAEVERIQASGGDGPHQKMHLYNLSQRMNSLSKQRKELEKDYDSTQTGIALIDEALEQTGDLVGTESLEYRLLELRRSEAIARREEKLRSAKSEVEDLDKTAKLIAETPMAPELASAMEKSYKEAEKQRALFPENFIASNLTNKERGAYNAFLFQQHMQKELSQKLAKRLIDEKKLEDNTTYGVFQNHEGKPYLSKVVVKPNSTNVLDFENGKASTTPEGWGNQQNQTVLAVNRGNHPYAPTFNTSSPEFATYSLSHIWDESNVEGREAVVGVKREALQEVSLAARKGVKEIASNPNLTGEQVIQKIKDATYEAQAPSGVTEEQMIDARKRYLKAYKWSIYNQVARDWSADIDNAKGSESYVSGLGSR